LIYLSKNILEKLTHSKSFERGEKYYKQGRVVDYREDIQFIEATVIGTDNYLVRINQNKWEHSCNCLAYREDSFCKHEIAVLLTKMNGRIVAKSKPQIKKRNTEKIFSGENEFARLLEKIPKEILIADIVEYAADVPELITFFRSKYHDKDENYFHNIENLLSKSICNLKRIRRGEGYSNKIFVSCREIEQLIRNLPISKQSTEILLDTGYKLTESLTSLDDSFGTIQNLISFILERAVLFLNSAHPEDLNIFYEYISKKSSFEFDFELVETILKTVENSDVLSEFITKLEKSLFRRDLSFNFGKEDVIRMLLDFYKTKNIERYEELAKEHLELSVLVKLDYVKFLSEQNRYDELLKAGMEMYQRYDVRPLINDALFRLGKIPEMIDTLKKQKTSGIEINALSLLKNINEFRRSKEFENLVDIMIENCSSIYDKLDLLNAVERYSQMKDVLLINSQDFKGDILIEKYAYRFALYNPALAIELYKNLIEIQLKKIQTSNHYKPLLEYMTMMKNLGESNFVTKLSNKLIKEYPSKKKLTEELKVFLIPKI